MFRRFLGVFARPEHPLALFLDDLQWLDAATLDLLEDLITQPDVRHLLLIGAYRDNEVSSSHPLMRTLEAIRKAGAKVQEIVLAPLRLDDVGRLVADALHCERDSAHPLAQLVHEKTGGNPFFAIQFLTALAEEGLLAFDPDAALWIWDLARIRAKGYTDNVVDLMVEKLKRLPDATQEALKQLACLGNVAEITTLTLVHGQSEEEIHTALWEAARTGLIFRLDGSYAFLHDRVQEAAYALIPDGERAAAHLRIGRLLASRTAPEDLEEKIFEIVNQLNRGCHLITSAEERERVAELNFIAGRRAKMSTAYASALAYLAAGRALLTEESWDHNYELIFAVEFHMAECELLTANMAAEDRLSMLARRARSVHHIAAVARLRLTLYTTLDRSDRGVEVCLEYLQRGGTYWSPHPTSDEVRREYDRIWSQLGSRSIEELIDLPLMNDPDSLAALDVLTEMVTPALFTDENLASLVICRMVNLSLEHGNSDGSCFAYVWLGIIAGPRFGNYKAGFRFGRLGYELVEKRGLTRFQARTYMSFGNIVMPWTRHIRTGRDLVRRAFDAANKIGDLTFAAYSCNNLNTNLLAAGDPLDDVQREAENGLEFAQKARFGLVIDIITAQLGLIRTLRGLTPTFGSFNDEQFDELRFERHLSSDPVLGAARVLVLDPKAAGSLLRRGLCFGRSRHHRMRNGCSGHRRHFLKRRSITSMVRFPTRRPAIPHPPTGAGSISRLWPPTTDSSKSGRRIARRISKPAPRWWARRSHASKAASSMPSISTNRPSARHTQTALSTMRRSPTNSPRASTRHVVSRRSRMRICRTPGTAISVGEPMVRCGNSTSYIRTSGRKSQCPVRRARSGHRSNTWISRP